MVPGASRLWVGCGRDGGCEMGWRFGDDGCMCASWLLVRPKPTRDPSKATMVGQPQHSWLPSAAVREWACLGWRAAGIGFGLLAPCACLRRLVSGERNQTRLGAKTPAARCGSDLEIEGSHAYVCTFVYVHAAAGAASCPRSGGSIEGACRMGPSRTCLCGQTQPMERLTPSHTPHHTSDTHIDR